MPRIAPSQLAGLTLDRAGGAPLYHQLFVGLRELIVSERLPRGTRLLATRDAAREFGCSRNTIALAYELLLAEGYIETRHGSGTFVTSATPEDHILCRPPERASDPAFAVRPQSRFASWLRREGAKEVVSDRSRQMGLPEVKSFPFKTWSRLFQEVWQTPDPALLNVTDPQGYEPLRAAIADHLATTRGLICDPAQIVITTGTSPTLFLLCRLLLEPGAPAYVEDPTVPWVSAKIVAAGGRPVSVPVDADGFDIETAVAIDPSAQLAIVTPANQYPSGAIMSQTRREALLTWADASDGWIIEDEYDADFRYSGRPSSPLAASATNGRVIYLGTFSKTIFPGLRLGYMVVPPALLNDIVLLRGTTDDYAAVPLQPVLARFLSEGHFFRHVCRMNKIYAERQQAAFALARLHLSDYLLFTPRAGGMCIVGELQPALSDWTESDIADLGAELGLNILPLSLYCKDRTRPPAVLLNFGRHDRRILAHLLPRLARALGEGPLRQAAE